MNAQDPVEAALGVRPVPGTPRPSRSRLRPEVVSRAASRS